jgi:hypothetical protein
LRWAIAFIAPYAAVLLAFVVYPFGYALWMASRPALYAELFADPLYPGTKASGHDRRSTQAAIAMRPSRSGDARCLDQPGARPRSPRPSVNSIGRLEGR